VVDGVTHHLSSQRPRLLREVDGDAAVTLSGPAWAFARLRQGSTLDDLAGDGTLAVSGSRGSRSRFRRVYALA
jgi:hypothetical protein